MVRFYFLIIGLSLSLNVVGQEWEWVKQIKGAYEPSTFYMDESENIYLFLQQANFSLESEDFSSFDNSFNDSSFIVKYTASGIFKWIKRFPTIVSMDVDKNGDIFILTRSCLIFKLNSEGIIQWSLPSKFNYQRQIKISGENFFYATSSSDGGDTLNYISSLRKYEKNGSIVWEKEFKNIIVNGVFSTKNDTTHIFASIGDDDSVFVDNYSFNCQYACAPIYACFGPDGKTIFARQTEGGYKTDITSAIILSDNSYIRGIGNAYDNCDLALSDFSGNAIWSKNYLGMGPGQGTSFISAIVEEQIKKSIFLNYTICHDGGDYCNYELHEIDFNGTLLNYYLISNVRGQNLIKNSFGTFISGYINDTVSLNNFVLLPEKGEFFFGKMNSLFTSINNKDHFFTKIKLSPNPTSGKFQLQFSDKMLNQSPNESKICVYDVMGRCVKLTPLAPFVKGESVLIDLSANAKGIYFVEVKIGEESYWQKVVIQ